MWLQSWISNFHIYINDRYLEYFLWSCNQANATEPLWWLINIGWGNVLVPLGNKPLAETMLTQCYPYGITRPQWVKPSLCNSFEDWAPTDFIYWSLIFKWVPKTWLQEDNNANNMNNGCQTTCPIDCSWDFGIGFDFLGPGKSVIMFLIKILHGILFYGNHKNRLLFIELLFSCILMPEWSYWWEFSIGLVMAWC